MTPANAFKVYPIGLGPTVAIRLDLLARPADSNQLGGTRHTLSKQSASSDHGQIEVEFKISGKGNLFGDGFALWLTKQRATPGPVFGSADKFEGLGVFFDTYKNNRPGTVFPYVLAMLGDGNTEYDQANDGKANELAGCSVCLDVTKDFAPFG